MSNLTPAPATPASACVEEGTTVQVEFDMIVKMMSKNVTLMPTTKELRVV